MNGTNVNGEIMGRVIGTLDSDRGSEGNEEDGIEGEGGDALDKSKPGEAGV